MQKEYRHTQVGGLTIALILAVGVFVALVFQSALGEAIAAAPAEGRDTAILTIAALVTGAVLVAGLASFYAFTIQVTADKLVFWFGLGVAKKVVPIENIKSVAVVKNPWYYLWGIKSIPGGWLYAIAPGGRAVELVLDGERIIRLGTNRPDEIKQALDWGIEAAAATGP